VNKSNPPLEGKGREGLQIYTCQRSLGEASHARSLNLHKERHNTEIKIHFKDCLPTELLS